MNRVAIVAATRTPIGSFQGVFANLSADRLGSVAIAEALRCSQVAADQIDEVLMGQVYSTGSGANPARQAAVHAALGYQVPATTINMLCGSGLKAVAMGAESILAGNAQMILAGGMESMSNAPYVLPKARAGLRLGHQSMVDTLLQDALWDKFYDCHMGSTAEHLAKQFNISRKDQDRFAVLSQQRYQAARQAGRFEHEIVPVAVPQRNGQPSIVRRDEHPRETVEDDKLAGLKPCFQEGGTVTAANASGINDGAAALLLVKDSQVQRLGLLPLAWIRSYCIVGLDPMEMGMGPALAIKKLLQKESLQLADIDLLEVNEAFAAQALAVGKVLDWDLERVNVNGGAIALGHPLGASGARVAVTLLHEMQRRRSRLGIAALCIGGGMGIAMLFENAEQAS
ncbi:MAG: acetyl-CoA C-acetyltransferase [Planctomycetales bacterium]|nr:acetyl-CoA C-acetyltransferase [Planctomycetaceae bacterium]MCA9131075.1 acetyl-CoA C-acetyltransferase [Planctomycetales bacterium]